MHFDRSERVSWTRRYRWACKPPIQRLGLDSIQVRSIKLRNPANGRAYSKQTLRRSDLYRRGCCCLSLASGLVVRPNQYISLGRLAFFTGKGIKLARALSLTSLGKSFPDRAHLTELRSEVLETGGLGHSSRMTARGLIRVARRAGIRLATNATRTSRAVTATKVRVSRELTP